LCNCCACLIIAAQRALKWSHEANSRKPGYLQSYRTPGGQRRFSQEQIDKFVGSLEQQSSDPMLDRQVG
jgi:hypothetical protein